MTTGICDFYEEVSKRLERIEQWIQFEDNLMALMSNQFYVVSVFVYLNDMD